MLKKQLNRLNVSLSEPYRKQILSLRKGEYVLRIIHQCEAVFKRPRSMFFTFLIENNSPENIKNILGLRDISAQNGVFVYVGAGQEESGFFIKEITLNITQDIESLEIELRTFLPNMNIFIDALQIYDAKISDGGLFGLNLKGLDRLFFDNYKLIGQTTEYIREKKWGEQIKILLYVNIDYDNINKFIEDLKILTDLLHKNHKILIYFKDKIDISSLNNLSNVELFFPSELGVEIDLNERQVLDILQTMEMYLPNIEYFGVTDSCFFEMIKEKKFFIDKSYLYNHSFLELLLADYNSINYLIPPVEHTPMLRDEYLLIDDFSKVIPVNETGTLNVSFFITNKENQVFSSSALVIIKYFGKNQDVIMPPENFGINSNFGAYKYLISGTVENPGLNELELIIPPNEDVIGIELVFKSWGKEYVENYLNTSTFKVVNHSSKTGLSGADRFIENLTFKDKVILIYTTAAYIGHETLELRPNRLTKEYIKLGYKVIFFAFSRVPEELEYPDGYDGRLLQCHKDDLLKYTSLISTKTLEEKIFICSSFPDIFALAAITRLKLFNDWELVYEIRDDMEEFNRVGYSKWYTTQLEVKVARLVDKIMTVSPRLAEKIKVMSRHLNDWSQKVKVIQNAAPDSLIEKSKYLRSSDFFQQKTESRIIGYIGHLTPAWFDWTLILTAARDFPDLEFEIIGHGMPETLKLPENVTYLGPKGHDEFLKISERWKVGLIPFITSPLTYGVDPNKIYEYLAANLLVVTADMGVVRECPATYVYTNYSEFKEGLRDALKVQYTTDLLSEITDYVAKSHWSNRAQKMIEFIHEEM